MRVLLTKISDARHRLDVVRDDGSVAGAELDSRSFLVHDLAHFAVEKEAGLGLGFWGALAAGGPLGEVPPVDSGDERWRAERLAAPFQSLWNHREAAVFASQRERYATRLRR
jgi:hypothetical protein